MDNVPLRPPDSSPVEEDDPFDKLAGLRTLVLEHLAGRWRPHSVARGHGLRKRHQHIVILAFIFRVEGSLLCPLLLIFILARRVHVLWLGLLTTRLWRGQLLAIIIQLQPLAEGARRHVAAYR